MSALILIADDRPASYELLRLSMRACGHRPRVAHEGAMALAGGLLGDFSKPVEREDSIRHSEAFLPVPRHTATPGARCRS